MSINESYYAQCPFYKKDKQLEIKCEGIEDGSRNIIQFFNKERKQVYYKTYCCGTLYPKCRVHKMLDAKYDGL